MRSLTILSHEDEHADMPGMTDHFFFCHLPPPKGTREMRWLSCLHTTKIYVVDGSIGNIGLICSRCCWCFAFSIAGQRCHPAISNDHVVPYIMI